MEVYVATGADMKNVDRITINEIGISSMVLMERAALSIAMRISERCANAFDTTVVCVCGYGNNGADGIVVGRILKSWGYAVEICMVGNENNATVECKQQLSILKAINPTLLAKNNITDILDRIAKTRVEEGAKIAIVDAIFGIGLTRTIEGDYKTCIEQLNSFKQGNNASVSVYSVDVPSGVGAGGKVMGVAVIADETISFGAFKDSLIYEPGCSYAGITTIADIGFPKLVFEKLGLKKITVCNEDENHNFNNKVFITTKNLEENIVLREKLINALQN